MYPINYSHAFRYRPLTYLSQDGQIHLTSDVPALEIILRRGELECSDIALTDTGATFSLFSGQIGQALGLPIVEGRREQLSTLGGPITAYAHSVEMEITYGWSLGVVEVLFSETDIPRNLLGRSDFLMRVQVGLHELTGTTHLKTAR